MKIPWRVVLFTTNVIIVIIVPKGISDISLCFKVYSGELKNISRKGPPENRAMKVVEVGNQGIPRCAFFWGDLGGGNFKYFLEFSPQILGEDEPNLTSIFLKWVGSTTN